MFTWLITLLSGPLFSRVVDAYKTKLDAGNNKDKLAADLAIRELQVQQAEVEAQHQLRIAQVGRWYEPEKLFAYTIWFYFTKVFIYDAALGLGTTDKVSGAVAEWAGLIMVFYFGKRGLENIAAILKK